jgi:AraC family ethanolamine operon transcriptional activator
MQAGASKQRLGTHATTPWTRVVHTHDAHEQAQAQEGWSLRYVQMSSGQFEGCVELLQLPGLSLVHESANQAMRQTGDLGGDSYLFALPASLHQGQAIFSGQSVKADQLMIGPSDGLDLCTPSHFSLIGVVIEADLLQSFWQQTHTDPIGKWLTQQRVAAIEPQVCQTLLDLQRSAFNSVHAHPEIAPNALTTLRDEIILAWANAWPNAVDSIDIKNSLSRKKVVDRACEWMLHTGSDQMLSMLEVCKRVGVSQRKLTYCFQQVLGMSPMQYQRTARLNCVRADLKKAKSGEGVHDIASRWGFWHMGQFSQDYKRMFGELPSSTLLEHKLR